MYSSSTFSNSSSPASSTSQPNLPLASFVPDFNALTLHLDRHNYYYWCAKVISAVRAHEFEGFLFGSVPIPPQCVDVPSENAGSPPSRVRNPDF